MKKAIKWILSILLVALLIGSAVWYLFVYDTGTVQEFLVAHARRSADNGHFETAEFLYNWSCKLSGDTEAVAIELADIYKDSGNYTKAEVTLTNALAQAPSTRLYMALSKTYVEQDKLLDAVTMLDNISDQAIKAELDAQRPSMPQVNYEPGYYNEYISLTFTASGGTLYVTSDGEYPSIADAPYDTPITLDAGQARIQALTVADSGLVSPLADLSYTVGGVVEEITIEDAAVAADLRSKLMYGENTPIFSNDLWTITEYVLPAEAESAEDLRYLTQLTRLTISGRQLDSLEFLSGLTHLEELNLDGCKLADLTPIASLPALKKLSLSGCNLSTIAQLDGAQALEKLNLSSNAIGDITVLGSMPMLKVVDLSHNAVTDLTAVSGLNQLEELDVSYNSIGSVAPAGVCASLKKLDITNNAVSDLSPLATLTGLTHFYAGYNALTDVSVLAGCLELQELNISNNKLVDISGLSVLVKLTHFDFSYNDVEVLPAFPTDCALIEINGEHNFMEDISALGGMEHLNLVFMDYNNLTDISFLADCPVLEQVNVYGTNVTNVEALLNRSIIVNYDPT